MDERLSRGRGLRRLACPHRAPRRIQPADHDDDRPVTDSLVALAGERLIDTGSRKKVWKSDTLLFWRLDCQALQDSVAGRSIHYRKAKVLLLGNTGVGKTGLGMVLAGYAFTASESTHGRHIWCLEERDQELPDGQREIRQVLLWDLAGQAGYRVFHQQSKPLFLLRMNSLAGTAGVLPPG